MPKQNVILMKNTLSGKLNICNANSACNSVEEKTMWINGYDSTCVCAGSDSYIKTASGSSATENAFSCKTHLNL